MWKQKAVIPPLCLMLLSFAGGAQNLMELHVPSSPTNQSSLDCSISSAEPLNFRYWVWLDPNDAVLCRTNDTDSEPPSGPCDYVRKKQLILNLEDVTMKTTGNYTCKIISNRGIKSAQVEVKIGLMPSPATLISGTSTSVCGLGLAGVRLLVTLLVM